MPWKRPVPYKLSGLMDKLYWRFVAGDAQHHCFKKDSSLGIRRGGFRSLCDRYVRTNSGGGASRRPEPVLRCGRCDGLEMERRGWEESGPTLEPRLKPQN